MFFYKKNRKLQNKCSACGSQRRQKNKLSPHHSLPHACFARVAAGRVPPYSFCLRPTACAFVLISRKSKKHKKSIHCDVRKKYITDSLRRRNGKFEKSGGRERKKTEGCIEPIQERRFDGKYERSDEATRQPLGFCSGSPPDFSRELIPNKQCFEVCLTGNAENVINMR